MSVFDNIANGEYENKLPWNPSPEMLTDIESQIEAAKRVVEDLKEQRQNLRKVSQKAYNEESARLQDQFKADLFKEFGVEKNPKAEKCYAKAYEQGHSSGYSDIANCFANMVELITDAA